MFFTMVYSKKFFILAGGNTAPTEKSDYIRKAVIVNLVTI